MKSSKKCLYVTYDGLLDPLGSTQVLAYQKYIAIKGWDLTIISYEKEDKSLEDIKNLRKELSKIGIKWINLSFKLGKMKYFSRLLKGIFLIKYLTLRNKYYLVHARGIQAASLVSLAFVSVPLIYDIRAFAGEWIDCGRLSKNSFISKYLIWLENNLIKKAKGLVVLDRSGYDYLYEKYQINHKRIFVIPTCTDISKYKIDLNNRQICSDRVIKFVFLGGARYPYRPDLAFLLISQLLDLSFNCYIDFINDRDQLIIKENIRRLEFPIERVNILKLKPEDVPKKLPEYDSGLVFNSTGFWRRMSSPTKLGEYLAAGLHVVGIEGIAVLDRLSEENNNVVNKLSEERIKNGLSKDILYKIINNIQNPKRCVEAMTLAQNNFSLQKAQISYNDLYNKIYE